MLGEGPSSSQCSYTYGDSGYWDARYLEEGLSSIDWYQRYSALRPFLREFLPLSSRILMAGCGNALMSEDMVKDGYVDIVNIDISSVVIEIMRRKCAHIPQLKCSTDIPKMLVVSCRTHIGHNPDTPKYTRTHQQWCRVPVTMSLPCRFVFVSVQHITKRNFYRCQPYVFIDMQMDVRDMSFFQDESFHCVIDKGTLDSLMCGTNAPLSAFQMLEEVSRILKPGGTYMLITYGDPSVRVPHLNKTGCKWKIMLYVIPRPGYQAGDGCSSSKSIMEPVPLTDKGLLPTDFVLEDPDSHYIYICKKMNELLEDDRVVVDATIV